MCIRDSYHAARPCSSGAPLSVALCATSYPWPWRSDRSVDMALRRRFVGCLSIAAACVVVSCKDGGDSKADAGAAPQGGAAALERLGSRCAQLGKACGEKDKHQEK